MSECKVKAGRKEKCYLWFTLPDKCAGLQPRQERDVDRYMEFMTEKGVDWNKEPDDIKLYETLSAEYGGLTAWCLSQRQLIAGFKPKLYDIWSFQGRDPRYGMEGYKWGLIAGQIVENLLYYFTEEGDIVFDPMAGGGTTIDVCKEHKRECLAFDIEPVRDDIQQHNIATGAPVKDIAQLAILDPPYFNMKIDAYKTFTDYLTFLHDAILYTTQVVKYDGYVALIVMDQTMKEGKSYPLIGEAYSLLKKCGLNFVYNVSLPLSTQQHTARHVNWAKEKKLLLGINRQMWVFSK